jgi:hypothetical protein
VTTAAVVLENVAPARQRAWPTSVAEFMLVGGGTLLLYPFGWALRAGIGIDASELALGFMAFHAAFLINDPHFAVTYLLFYKNAKRRAFGNEFCASQRVRYLFAGFVVPVALALWIAFAFTAGSAKSMGLLMELMFLLVGWHYVKQGFGVLSVLSARARVRISVLERRVLLTHSFAGWAYAWASPASPEKAVSEKGVVYTALARPHAIESLALIVFALSTIAVVCVLVRKWRTERALPPLSALSGFLISVWLWTVYSSVDPLMVYAIPALHSIQYLYFVWLLKRNAARENEGPPAFGRPVAIELGVAAAAALALGWVLFHGAPDFLDGARALQRSKTALNALGATPYFASIFAFVNIHHYFMDHVIWRRENPETRHLRV